jgi:flagellar basal body-associated protein FliL
MGNIIEQFKNADSKTKSFIINCILYSLIIILAVVYCFARLDFVRSDQANQNQHQTEG